MALSQIAGEYGIVAEPDFRLSEKGNAWMKLRGKAQDRVRDANGNWGDGDPCFVNIMVSGKPAEHLFESVAKGDSVIVVGKLKQREWNDKEGNKHTDTYIDADSIGVSVRWNPAKTPRVAELSGGSGVAVAASMLGATEVQSEVPF